MNIEATDEALSHGPMSPIYNPAEDEKEATLRPRYLSEFQGQQRIKENLLIFIKAARERGEALDHLFLMGPPGLGKTTLALVVASEMGSDFKPTSAPAIEKPKDLAGILTNLRQGGVLFIDEIHRLKPAIEEMLYIAMEDFELDWIIGQGPAARTVRIPLQPFTLVGATTKAGMVSAPLSSRFGISLRLDYYAPEELASVIRRSSRLLDIKIEENAIELLAKTSRGTPRIANRLLRACAISHRCMGMVSSTVMSSPMGLRGWKWIRSVSSASTAKSSRRSSCGSEAAQWVPRRLRFR